MNIQAWKDEFSGKKILIWGFGREGVSSLKWIRHCVGDIHLDIAEQKVTEEIRTKAEQFGNVTVIAQEDADFSSYDMVLKSPGIVLPPDMDHSNITQQTHLFLKHHRNQTVGITGTKGKSTTTSLCAAVLSKQYKTHLIGNIGIPCFDILESLQDDDLCAFELSCHQLEHCIYSPHTAVYLNLYEEHLDHFPSYQAYGDAKANVFRHQAEGELAILGQDLPYIDERPDALLIGKDIFAEGNVLHVNGKRITVEESRLLGSHNMQNLAVVYALAMHYGISDAAFLQAVREFSPLHHRLEYIGEHNGIRFVNDSISTIGQTAQAALKALPDTDVILIGGMDRGIDYTELEDFLAEQKDLWVIFMYATGKRIYEELSKRGLQNEKMILKEDLKEALNEGVLHCRKGHILLLSPAASSYDHFKNFEERGEIFAGMAMSL